MVSSSVLAITAGDPCGIGAEVILKALASRPLPPLIVIGDLTVFARAAQRLRRRLPNWRRLSPGDPWPRPSRRPLFLDCGHRARFAPAHSSAEAGAASLGYLKHAVALWQAGRVHGLVTGPVTKWSIAQALPGFVGQTEWLAQATRAQQVVMTFVSDRLRVALLTRHLPLNRVSRAITPAGVRATVRLVHQALVRDFGIAHPQLAVCGVNPHAGEQGTVGEEERRVMIPVIRQLRRAGVRCEGPLAADGLFADARRYDAVICAYHDQGLIPFKMAARDRGCQLSIGLPLIRTSPDHGSGLDIAGKGIAHPGSMIYALRLAARLAHADRR